MKKLIISLTLIYAVFCTFDSCNACYDQSQCANIKIEFTGYSCYQFESEYSSYECTGYPDDKKDQEAFYKMEIALLKEVVSSGLYNNPEKLILSWPEKKTYNKGETIKTKTFQLSPLDKEIIRNKNSCLYHLYGRYVEVYNKNHAASYPDVKDKNLCFNSDKFDEALNLMDCGYAEITFPLKGKDFTMTTCYPFPNRKMPENVQNIYNKYIIESQIAAIKQIASGEVNGKVKETGELLVKKNGLINLMDKTSENTSENEIRKLQSTKAGVYEFVIENKYGKKYKYTNDVQGKPIVINEGNKGQEEIANDIPIKVDKSNFFELNILFLLFLILLL